MGVGVLVSMSKRSTLQDRVLEILVFVGIDHVRVHHRTVDDPHCVGVLNHNQTSILYRILSVAGLGELIH